MGAFQKSKGKKNIFDLLVLSPHSSPLTPKREKKTSSTSPDQLHHRVFTFPSLATEEGSEFHETLPSVSFLLFIETLTRFPGKPLLSPDDFFPTDALCLFDFSWPSKFPFAATFFVDIGFLFSCLDDLADSWFLLSSLDTNLSLDVLFLGACQIHSD